MKLCKKSNNTQALLCIFEMDIRPYSALEQVVTGANGQKSTPREITSLDLKQIDGLKDIARAQVRIRKTFPFASNGCLGSGFIISDDGLVVTNKHVLGSVYSDRDEMIAFLNKKKPIISLQMVKENGEPGYDTVLADVIDVSETSDLALLRMRKEPGISLKFNETEAEPGTDSYTLSCPGNNKLQVVTYGQILTLAQAVDTAKDQIGDDPTERFNAHCSISYLADRRELILSDNSTDNGSSGSALLDRSGDILGVVTESTKNPYLPKVSKFQAERYVRANGEILGSEPSFEVLEFLEMHGIKAEKLSDGKIRAADFQAVYESSGPDNVVNFLPRNLVRFFNV